MNYFGNVLRAERQGNNTLLQISVSEDLIPKLNRYAQDGKVHAEVVIDDGRRIRPEQRKKAYATLRDIANYTGDVPERLKEIFKLKLIEQTGQDYFSLSNCSVSTARDYITLLVDFCIDWNIPLTDLAINRVESIDAYLYKCLKTRTCAITGQKGADVHHVNGSKVGMGRNRNYINHANLELIALSREWHNRVHAEGERDIFNTYKIYGIRLDELSLKELNLKAEDIS